MPISANELYEELLACGIADSPAARLYLEQALEVFVGRPLNTEEFMSELLSESDWTPEAQVRIRSVVEAYEGEQIHSVKPHAPAPLAHSVVKMIGGEECTCYAHGNTGKMLLELDGTFGDLDINCVMLVPMTMEEPALDVLADLWLTEQEHEQGLPVGESCTSSSWWVGADRPPEDVVITSRYDYLIEFASRDMQFVNHLSGESLSKVDFIAYVWDEAERQFNDCHESEQWRDLCPSDRLTIYRDQYEHQLHNRDWEKRVKAPTLSAQIRRAEERRSADAGTLMEHDISR